MPAIFSARQLFLREKLGVAIHGDYTPRNWMADPLTGQWTGVFDLEHVCWDVRAAEFKLHYDRFFMNRPDLEKAFFEGYGQLPNKRMHLQIQLVQAYQAISGIIWAVEHKDQRFSEAENGAISPTSYASSKIRKSLLIRRAKWGHIIIFYGRNK